MIIFQQWLNSVNSESLKNPWNSKSIKTDYLQSQTKSENQRNPRKSRISCILSAVLIFVDSSRIQNSWNSGTAERMQEILGFFGFLGVLDFLGFL
jgi:hypothetical protein